MSKKPLLEPALPESTPKPVGTTVSLPAPRQGETVSVWNEAAARPGESVPAMKPRK